MVPLLWEVTGLVVTVSPLEREWSIPSSGMVNVWVPLLVNLNCTDSPAFRAMVEGSNLIPEVWISMTLGWPDSGCADPESRVGVCASLSESPPHATKAIAPSRASVV